MAAFFAIVGGIGIAAAAIMAFAIGADRGYSEGYHAGANAMREHITEIMRAVQSEFETIKLFEGSEFIAKILNRLKDE